MNQAKELSAITYPDPASSHLPIELGNHQMISQLVVSTSVLVRDGATVAAAAFSRSVSDRLQWMSCVEG